MNKSSSPDYKKIYNDLIERKYPHLKNQCSSILRKDKLSTFDVLNLNAILSEKCSKKDFIFNQQHKVYSYESICYILDYQIKHQLNNTQTAVHFKVSRPSLRKWKKLFSTKDHDMI